MAQERMIPVTNVGIWDSGVADDPNRYNFVPKKKSGKTGETQNREEVIRGLKLGIPVWGVLSAVSVSFWAILAYWLFF